MAEFEIALAELGNVNGESEWCWDDLEIKIPGIDLGSELNLGSELDLGSEPKRKKQKIESDSDGDSRKRQKIESDDSDGESTITFWDEDGIKIWNEDDQDGDQDDQDGEDGENDQLTCLSQRRATTPKDENCSFCGEYFCLCEFAESPDSFDWLSR